MAIDDDEVEEVSSKKGGSGVLKIVMIVLSVVLLIGVSIGVTLYMTGAMTSMKSAAATNTAEADGESIKQDNALYYPFDPAFVVNFSDGKQIRYLQVSIVAMSHDPQAIEGLKTHMPVIRNNLILMLSNLNFDTLNSVEGKKKLQQEALAEIQNILKEKTGKPGIEEIYFTGFVMQ